MHIGKKSSQEVSYKLLGEYLERVQEEKDIGVIIDENLTFEKHICEKVKKANSTFAMIRRIFQHLDENTFIPLYKSLVRTHLDYASSVWFPYKTKYIEMVEGVQRRATKQIPGMSDLTYSERLKKLKLPTLSYRRHRGDMIEIYKITSGKYDTKAANFVKFRRDHVGRETARGNSKQLLIQRARLDIRKYNFTLRAAKIWNSLPEDVISAKTTNSFKQRLDKHWENQDILYDYKAAISGSHVVSYTKTEVGYRESNEEDP